MVASTSAPAGPPPDAVPFPPLPAEFTIDHAADTRQHWLDWWSAHGACAGSPLAIDAAAVDVVDAAGVQLLVALRHHLQRHDRELRLCQPSGPLRAACGVMGLAGLIPEDAAA